MKGWGWQKVQDPRSLNAVRKRWSLSIASGEPFNMEFPLRGADGTFRMFMTQGAPVKDKHNRIFRWIGTNTDVDHQRHTEERLRRLYDSGIMGVFYWTEDGAIHDANDRFLEMIAYTRMDLNGGEVDWAIINPPDYESQDRRDVAKLKETGSIGPIEKEYLRKDGSRIHVEMGAVFSAAPRAEGVAIVLDITKRKQVEADLADLNDTLEHRVKSRTEELARTNRRLSEIRASLHAVLDGATEVAIVATDLKGVVTVFNKGAERMLQYRAEEVIGMHTPDLFHSRSECDQRCVELSSELGRNVLGFEVFAAPVRLRGSDEREWTRSDVPRTSTWVFNPECRRRRCGMPK